MRGFGAEAKIGSWLTYTVWQYPCYVNARSRVFDPSRLHEIDRHDVLATTVAADRDEALESFSEKLRMMLTLEGDPSSADYLLDEWPEAAGARCKPYHSSFRRERSGCAPPGIMGRWSWSEHRVSSEQFSSTAHAPYP